MATVTNTGTLTASSDEQTLGAAKTDGKTYACQVDLTNMAAGDVVEVRAKIKVVSAGSAVVIYRATFANAQAYPAIQTPPILAPYEITFTLKQAAGTNRDYPYALMSLD